MRQFETGYGNYTIERDEFLAGFTNDEIIEKAAQIDKLRVADQ
jgi:hypothetical protein